tara:strand:- start:1072 stop:1266 length:195 start_codon:yes stop_codon:yes gene_type:complete
MVDKRKQAWIGFVPMSEDLERELRMMGVLDHKTPAFKDLDFVKEDNVMWVRDDVVFDSNGEPNF